jgi:hypothetical protein
MKKRFVVMLDSSTKEQNEAFREYLKAATPGLWWHWLENSWLLVDPKGTLTASELTDKVMVTYPGVSNLVLEFSDDHDTWSGFGPMKPEKNMFPWLRKNWR